MTTPYYNADAPVVVQGQIVDMNHNSNSNTNSNTNINTNSNNLVSASAYNYNNNNDNDNNGASTKLNPNPNFDTEDDFKGKQQPKGCRDGFWALLFYVHIGAIAYCTAVNAPVMAQDVADDYGGGAQRFRWLEEQNDNNNNGDDNNNNYDNNGDEEQVSMDVILTILSVAGLAGFVLSSLALIVMMNFAQGLIKMALFFNIFIAGAMAILALVAGALPMALMSGLGLLFSIYYAYVVWNRIEFAAANLVTAVTAVRSNMGLAFFSYTNLIVSFLWSIWWAVAFVTTMYVLGDCDAEGNCENETNGGILFLFLVSYFWTAQVIKNVVHTTVAGTVGTWWYAPLEAASCCSRGVRDSYIRSITTSFGSICLGSLIVAIIQATKEILHSMREQQDSFLMCFAECLLGCIESLVEYFNQWAYVYVGLYGYSFLEAGRNVMTLFKSRGWTAIVADFLVDTVLLMVSVAVGVLTGVVGVVMGSMLDLGNSTMGGAFVAGALIGFVMCSTLFSLVSSAVNAVIVCYAEAPAEFQANYPQLSDQMRASWKKAYPREFSY